MNEPQIISGLIERDATVHKKTCDRHGDYESRNLFRKIWSTCPQCAAEEAEVRRQEERDREAAERQSRWARRLGEAGIPERFQDRRLESYSAINSGQKRALEFATIYASKFDEVEKTGRCAIFCGAPGTGKTHLAVGVGLHVMETGRLVLFTTVQRMVRRMKDAWRKDATESEGDVIGLLVQPELLILDEIGVQFGSEFEKNLMFDVLNERYEKRHPTLLLSNLTAKEVKAFLGERVYDRLREDGGECVAFDWASYRGKQ